MDQNQKRLTKWEVGQIFIKCHDALAESIRELRENHYMSEALFLERLSLDIGHEFNKMGSHDFGLPEH